MRFNVNKTYTVSAYDIRGKFISSTVNSFDSKVAVLYWAKKAADEAHRTLHYINVWNDTDNTYIQYRPSGKVFK